VALQRAVGITASRANAGVALARALTDRRLTLSSTADRRSTRGVLLGLPGVGPWTADMARTWAPHRSLAVLHLWTDHALDPRR
jgi:3-methyladenine DNA glycosylase/8-oxoguanine DNA glycosylase